MLHQTASTTLSLKCCTPTFPFLKSTLRSPFFHQEFLLVPIESVLPVRERKRTARCMRVSFSPSKFFTHPRVRKSRLGNMSISGISLRTCSTQKDERERFLHPRNKLEDAFSEARREHRASARSLRKEVGSKPDFCTPISEESNQQRNTSSSYEKA